MTSYILPLTYEEGLDPSKLGYKFIKENESRWVSVDNDVGAVLEAYNMFFNYIVKDNIVYTIYKDYTLIPEKKRIFLCYDKGLETDKIS